MFNLPKILKCIAVGLTFAGFSQMSIAAPPTPASIEKLITLSKLDQMFQEGLQGLQPFFNEEATLIVQQIVQNTTLTTDQQKIAQQLANTMSSFTSAAMSNPQVKEKIRDIIKTTYTEEELNVYNSFLSTPEGQSINLKSTKVSIELQTFMEKLVQKSTNNLEYEQQIEQIISPLLEQ